MKWPNIKSDTPKLMDVVTAFTVVLCIAGCLYRSGQYPGTIVVLWAAAIASWDDYIGVSVGRDRYAAGVALLATIGFAVPEVGALL